MPICPDGAAFDSFLDHRHKGVRPRDLYGEFQITALRSVQPFAFASEAAAHGVEISSDADAEMAADPF